MALIRGYRGLCPCPVCLIPSAKLDDIHATAPMRDMEESQKIVADGDEEQLKAQGLRPIKVFITAHLVNCI
jgi:hypothetical protein